MSKNPRSKKYLAWIRSHPCAVTSTSGDSGFIHAHHVRLFGDGGCGLKPSDYRTVPLCAVQHDALHNMGEKTFWKANDIDIDMLVLYFISKYIDEQSLSIRAMEALEGVLQDA